MNKPATMEPHAIIAQAEVDTQAQADALVEKLACIQLYDEKGKIDFRLGHKLMLIYDLYQSEPQKALALYGMESFGELLTSPREPDSDYGGLDIPYSSAMKAIRRVRAMKTLGIEPADIQGMDYTKIDMMIPQLSIVNWKHYIEWAKTVDRATLKADLDGVGNEPISTSQDITKMSKGELRQGVIELKRYFEECLNRSDYAPFARKALSVLDTIFKIQEGEN